MFYKDAREPMGLLRTSNFGTIHTQPPLIPLKLGESWLPSRLMNNSF
jgi:hypothetical protein